MEICCPFLAFPIILLNNKILISPFSFSIYNNAWHIVNSKQATKISMSKLNVISFTHFYLKLTNLNSLKLNKQKPQVKKKNKAQVNVLLKGHTRQIKD